MMILLFLFLLNLHISNPEYDFGELKEGAIVAHKFLVGNKSNRSIKILSISAACGCTQPIFPKEIKAGSKDFIEVGFNTKGLKGFVERKLILITDDQKEYYTITIKANVK